MLWCIKKALYEGISRTSWTHHLDREWQVVQLSFTRCCSNVIFSVSLVSCEAITLCIASQQVFTVVHDKCKLHFSNGLFEGTMYVKCYNRHAQTSMYAKVIIAWMFAVWSMVPNYQWLNTASSSHKKHYKFVTILTSYNTDSLVCWFCISLI